MARGAYWSELGNTPGHLNHWSRRSFVRAALAPRRGGREPLAVSLDDAACPPLGSPRRRPPARAEPAQARSYGSGARILSVGIACTGLLDARLLLDLKSRPQRSSSASRIALLWSIMFVIISVIYRPIEQLLSRTIAERRAKGHAEHSLRVPLLIQAGFALDVPGGGAGAPGRDRRQRVRPLPGAL